MVELQLLPTKFNGTKAKTFSFGSILKKVWAPKSLFQLELSEAKHMASDTELRTGKDGELIQRQHT